MNILFSKEDYVTLPNGWHTQLIQDHVAKIINADELFGLDILLTDCTLEVKVLL
jgi:hypothetical protein